MADIQELKAETRERVGKGAARTARREGRVPAVIYGDKKPPVTISVSRFELDMKLRTGIFLTTLLNIDVDGEKERVIPRDVQLDPVRDFPVHVDFLRLGKGARITIEVPVQFINEDLSEGLTQGGVLNVVRFAIEVNCPADAIPDSFEVDLADLGLGDSVHASAISLPEGVELTITDRDFTVATIAAPAGLTEAEDTGEVEEGEEGVEGVEGDEDAKADGESESGEEG